MSTSEVETPLDLILKVRATFCERDLFHEMRSTASNFFRELFAARLMETVSLSPSTTRYILEADDVEKNIERKFVAVRGVLYSLDQTVKDGDRAFFNMFIGLQGKNKIPSLGDIKRCFGSDPEDDMPYPIPASWPPLTMIKYSREARCGVAVFKMTFDAEQSLLSFTASI